jgi:hypothetical protein
VAFASPTTSGAVANTHVSASLACFTKNRHQWSSVKPCPKQPLSAHHVTPSGRILPCFGVSMNPNRPAVIASRVPVVGLAKNITPPPDYPSGQHSLGP